jgi:hypothetical protein
MQNCVKRATYWHKEIYRKKNVLPSEFFQSSEQNQLINLI